MTLVDTNILLDILSGDPQWLDWSATMMARRAEMGPLYINDVIVAELSARMEIERELDVALDALNVIIERTPKPALFLAGKAFRKYRNSGGTRTGVLPDMFIGAHALISHYAVLTRDTRRYGTYFPEIMLLTPD
jgi:predicted nucleic acid-binding protein